MKRIQPIDRKHFLCLVFFVFLYCKGVLAGEKENYERLTVELKNKLNQISISNEEVRKFYLENKEIVHDNIFFSYGGRPHGPSTKIIKDIAQNSYNALKNNKAFWERLKTQNGHYINYSISTGQKRKLKELKPGEMLAPHCFSQGCIILRYKAAKDWKDVNHEYYKKVLYNIKRNKIIESYFLRSTI